MAQAPYPQLASFRSEQDLAAYLGLLRAEIGRLTRTESVRLCPLIVTRAVAGLPTCTLLNSSAGPLAHAPLCEAPTFLECSSDATLAFVCPTVATWS